MKKLLLAMTIAMMVLPVFAQGYYAGRQVTSLTTNKVVGTEKFSRPVRVASIYIYWNTNVNSTVTVDSVLNTLSYLRLSNTVQNAHSLVLLPEGLWLAPATADYLRFTQNTNVTATVTIDYEN